MLFWEHSVVVLLTYCVCQASFSTHKIETIFHVFLKRLWYVKTQATSGRSSFYTVSIEKDIGHLWCIKRDMSSSCNCCQQGPSLCGVFPPANQRHESWAGRMCKIFQVGQEANLKHVSECLIPLICESDFRLLFFFIIIIHFSVSWERIRVVPSLVLRHRKQRLLH